MYSVGVREHIMVAHSLPRPVFGPAQNLHGATYTVEVEFLAEQLGADSIVIDIALAHEALGEVLAALDYQNLDEHPAFAGQLTTTEFLARHIHDALRERLGARFSGRLRVRLWESPAAWGAYEGAR